MSFWYTDGKNMQIDAGAAVHSIWGIVAMFVTHKYEVLYNVSCDKRRLGETGNSEESSAP